jgi:hypothetical protein
MPFAEKPATSSVDTTTSYMGLRLRHPFMAGASPDQRHGIGQASRICAYLTTPASCLCMAAASLAS